MIRKYTTNIYNDFQCYKHPEINKQLEIMSLNSIKDNIRQYGDTNTTVKYKLCIKLSNELDQREYSYNNLSEVLTASYFISLLTKKGVHGTITDYNIYTEIIDGNNDTLFEDYTDNIHYWNNPVDQQIQEENEQLKEQLAELELYKKFISDHNSQKLFDQYKNKNSLYWYELKFRSPSPGCQPNDFIEIDNQKGKWGIVGYDRELSKKELNEYEMKKYIA